MLLNWYDFIVIFCFFFLFLLVLFYILKYFLTRNRHYTARYPSIYKCNDGHVVRSLSELLIDNYLHQNDIKHLYEDYVIRNSSKQYKYDWFLPDKKIYLEFFGYSGRLYNKRRLEKEKFYFSNHLNMISIVPEDLGDLHHSMVQKLGTQPEMGNFTKHQSQGLADTCQPVAF